MLFIGVMCCNAQIYNTKEIVDKFDDTISKVTVKTLITVTDSTIMFETKGEKPEVYDIIPNTIFRFGEGEECKQLIGSVWGHETHWLVRKNDGFLEIVHREICCYSFNCSNSFQYETDLWWIKDEHDSRIIYRK